MKIPSVGEALKIIGALAVLGAAAGIAVVTFGLISITASSGHWAITDWFLHSAMRRAVSTQSLGIPVPPLDEMGLIVQGAGHYEIGCAPCHGRPGAAPPPIPERMTPPPPYLPPRIDEWQARELFFIVKNGVKFTGMPAWPAPQRDDEVWAVVAFLSELPQLDAEQYVELAFGEVAEPALTSVPGGVAGGAPVGGAVVDGAAADSLPVAPPAAALCFRCHGSDGAGRGVDAFPRLAGLAPQYLHATLESYANGVRPSGIMQPVAAGLDADSLTKLAEYYGSASPVIDDRNERVPAAEAAAAETAELDAEERANIDAAAERGRSIASTGIPARDIAACSYCHGPDRVARNSLFPPLAGQPLRYLEEQLELWVREDGRGGTPYAHVMHEAAKELSPQEISDVAAYYARLPVEP